MVIRRTLISAGKFTPQMTKKCGKIQVPGILQRVPVLIKV